LPHCFRWQSTCVKRGELFASEELQRTSTDTDSAGPRSGYHFSSLQHKTGEAALAIDEHRNFVTKPA
jgi:hypothetical protein